MAPILLMLPTMSTVTIQNQPSAMLSPPVMVPSPQFDIDGQGNGNKSPHTTCGYPMYNSIEVKTEEDIKVEMGCEEEMI